MLLTQDTCIHIQRLNILPDFLGAFPENGNCGVSEEGDGKNMQLCFFLCKGFKEKHANKYHNVILMPSKNILYNTAYVPDSNMATSATVSVYCTAIKKCHLSIYHDHYTAK